MALIFCLCNLIFINVLVSEMEMRPHKLIICYAVVSPLWLSIKLMNQHSSLSRFKFQKLPNLTNVVRYFFNCCTLKCPRAIIKVSLQTCKLRKSWDVSTCGILFTTHPYNTILSVLHGKINNKANTKANHAIRYVS